MPGIRSRKKLAKGFLFNNDAELIRSGIEFFNTLVKLIDSAVHEIHLQTYIFSEDETGTRISEALIRASRRGVKIFVLLDAYGSNNLASAFIDKMKDEKIELRFFGRIFKKGRWHIGRRLHRKAIVIDGITSVISGINISNNYNSLGGTTPWLDFGVIVKGEVSKRLHLLCAQSWLKIRFRSLSEKLIHRAQQKIEHSERQIKIRVRQNDWKLGKNQVAQSYYQMIRLAEESLIIVGGYFLPGRTGRKLIQNASERGVAIQLVVAESSDVGLMRNAMLYLYDWLLRNKVQIFEYKPSNVHGKGIVADKKILSIGSYDLNALSTYSNIELNLDIDDHLIAGQFNDLLEEIIAKDCKEIKEEIFKTRTGVTKRIGRWLAYRLVKSFFVLSIWFSKKDEDIYQ